VSVGIMRPPLLREADRHADHGSIIAPQYEQNEAPAARLEEAVAASCRPLDGRLGSSQKSG
jgi:hypothetical protein